MSSKECKNVEMPLYSIVRQVINAVPSMPNWLKEYLPETQILEREKENMARLGLCIADS